MQTLESIAHRQCSIGAGDFQTHPDVVVTHANQTAVFKTHSHRVAEWLRRNYWLSMDNADGCNEIHVHPTRCQGIIEQLRAAGFEIAIL
jgi:hypothetical protein